MTFFQKTRFLLTWSWVGFATFPRTVQQAWIILFRIKMPWVFTPQPRANTMPAKASAAQAILEKQFRGFLKHVMQKCNSRLQVKYIPAGLIGEDSQEEIMAGTPVDTSDSECQELEIRVLTPLFYSRIIQYDSIHSGLLAELHSGTIALSDPFQLQNIDFTFYHTTSDDTYSSLIFSFISCLKRTPKPIGRLADEAEAHKQDGLGEQVKSHRQYLGLPHRPECLGDEASPADDWKRQLHLSGMDVFALTDTFSCPKSEGERWSYVQTVSKLLLADRLALGSVELFDLEIFVVKLIVAWVLVGLSTQV